MPKFTPSVNEITEKVHKLLRKYIKISRHFLKKIPPIATNFNSATALPKNILDVMKRGTTPDVPDVKDVKVSLVFSFQVPFTYHHFEMFE